MKLWIDDTVAPPDTDWVWVRTYTQAVDKIATGQVTEIDLDGDLGMNEDGKHGIHIADFIRRGAVDGSVARLKYRCHSRSWMGNVLMENELLEADTAWAEKEKS